MYPLSGFASNSYQSLSNIYRALSTGKRINSAADDAAGLAVAKSLELQATGNSVRINNAKDEQNAINIQDGSLSGVTASLQRMGELALQASNGIYSKSDLSTIQSEINQLKQHIGSEQLDSLGLTGFDVTSGQFDVSSITNAINTVSSMRGDYGAQSNAIDHFMSYSANAADSMTASQSQIEDLDYAEMFSKLKMEQTLFQYRLAMQAQSMDRDQAAAGRMLRAFGFSLA